MAANIQDRFAKVINGTTRPVATTLSAQKLSGANSATVVSTTGWDTSTALHGIMYRTDAAGVKVPGSQIDWKATVAGTTLSNFTVTAGSDDTYAIGTTVELSPTPAWADDLAGGVAVSLDQTTGHIATTGVATFTDHIDMADTKAIRDGNDNELLKVSQTASAVNEFTIANAATGNGPILSATGGDANADINLNPKGTGALKVGGNTVQHGAWTTWTPTWANLTVGNGTHNYAKYCVVGKMVHFQLKLSLGNTSTIAANPTFTLPVNAAASLPTGGAEGGMNIGTAIFQDTGTEQFGGRVSLSTASIAALFVWDSAGTNIATGAVTDTNPFAWAGANADAIIVQGFYEAA